MVWLVIRAGCEKENALLVRVPAPTEIVIGAAKREGGGNAYGFQV